MSLKIVHNGVEGRFFKDDEWVEFTEKMETMKNKHSEQLSELKNQVVIAKGESKYKLKKLASVIERKDKQIASLKNKNLSQ